MGLCCYTNVLCYGIGIIAIVFIVKMVKKMLLERKLARWNNTPKDVVILHGFPAAKVVPNASPFVLKVLTFLRMANINYKLDRKDVFGPKGKTPWISLNGEHTADSQMIIDYLRKKFEKSLNGSYSEEHLAIGTAVRVMLEEHAFWGVALDRFIFSGTVTQIMKANPIYLWTLKFVAGFIVRRSANAHGIGRHSEKEIVQLVSKDIRTVSKILGNKKFILGDEPCEDDCAIFGMLAQFLWGLPGSPYEKLVNGELTNIKEYCMRMKEKFYADWDYCLAK